MKFKKSIALILSLATVLNLCCSCLAQVKGAELNNANGITTERVEFNTDDLSKTGSKVQNVNADSKAKKDLTASDESANSDAKKSDVDHKKKLIDKFLLNNAQYLPANKIKSITDKLQELSDDDIRSLNAISFNKPDVMLLVSIFAGSLGIDRMIIGKVGTGVLKLILTAAGLGPGIIWWLIDIFKIREMTKEENWKKLNEIIK